MTGRAMSANWKISSNGPSFSRRGISCTCPLRNCSRSNIRQTEPLTTLETAERDHIVRALQASKWILGGPAGAAAKLGMKRTTLQSKLLKLGISRPS